MEAADLVLRDAILSVLRDRPVAHTAEALVPFLPRRVRLMVNTPTGFCDGGYHRPLQQYPGYALLECRGPAEHLVSYLPSANVVLHQLARLHAGGYVQRFPGGRDAAATWIWIEPALVPSRSGEVSVNIACERMLAGLGAGTDL